MFIGWNRRRSGEKKDVPLIEEDVFSLAPFKLPPRKSQHQQQAMQGDQVVTMLAMREKRRVHRYENVPPLQLESVVQRDLILERSATTTPPAVVAKSQDLFGLVPFTALTPRWSPEAESSGTYLMRIIIFFFFGQCCSIANWFFSGQPRNVKHSAEVVRLPAIRNRGLQDCDDDLCDPVIDSSVDDVGVSNLSFEDIGPEEAQWNMGWLWNRAILARSLPLQNHIFLFVSLL